MTALPRLPKAWPLLLLLVGFPSGAQAVPPREAAVTVSHRALVVVGLGGDLAHAVDFARSGGETVRALRDRGYETAALYLFEDGARPPASAATEGASLDELPSPDGAARLEDIRSAFAEATAADRPSDVFLVILAGHADLGASAGGALARERKGEWRMHLPGPDLSASELRSLIAAYPGRVVLVAATPHAGALAGTLAGERAFLIASSQARQRNMLAMPEGVARALEEIEPGADASALASAVIDAVGAWYRENGFLATEKPLIAGDTAALGSLPLFGAPATAWAAASTAASPDSSALASTDPFSSTFDPPDVPDSTWAGADAVILFRLIDVTVDERGEVHERRREIVKILTEQGRHAADLEFVAGGFDDTWALVRAEVVRGGERTRLGPDAVYESTLGFGEEDSATPRHVAIRPTGMTPGSIADIEYIHRERTFAGSWAPAGEWLLAAEHPMAELAVRITASRRSKLRAVTRRLPALTTREERYVRTWQTVARNLPALKSEPYAPPLPDVAPRLMLVEPSTWEEVALWYSKVAEGARLPDSAVVVAAAKQLDGRDTLVALYDWVARSIRYVSVPLGTHSYKPSPAAATLRRGFGDCKDKASLLISAFAAFGQEAYIALIGAGGGELIEEAPRASAFNHAIVAVPQGDGWLFLDPTSEVAPYGTLPVMDEGRTALIVKGESAVLVRTPIAPAEANRLEIERLVRPDSVGARVFETRRYHGQNAFLARMMRRRMSADDWKTMMASELTHYFSGAELDSFTSENLDSVTAPFVLGLSYRLPAPAGLRPVPFYGVLAFPPAATRTLPFSLPSTLLIEETVTVDASGFETAPLPAATRLTNSAGELVIEFERIDGGMVRARHRLLLPTRDLPAEAYADLVALTRPPAVFLGAPVAVAAALGAPGWVWPALVLAAFCGALGAVIIIKRRKT